MKKLALALVSFVISLGLAELGYRWWTAPDPDAPDGTDHEWRRRYNRLNETLYMRSEIDALIYEPRPDSEVEMEYGVARFNAAGLRQDFMPAEDASDVVRVAVVGDSLVWTEFLETEHTLPSKIGDALGSGYEVLNFGVSGYDTTQEVAYYEHRVRPFHPNVVVVVFCMNDMMIMSGPYERHATDAEKERKHAQDRLLDDRAPVRRETLDWVLAQEEEEATFRTLSALGAHFRRWSFARNYIDEYLVMLNEEDRVETFRTAVRRVGELIREDGARAIFVISPVLDAWDDYHWDPIHDEVGHTARLAGFEVVDPLEGWRDEITPDEIRIWGDNLHYNRGGNALFGETIAEVIEEAP